ncbi:microprocessor complex subunit DGCR8-like [Macrosteles quadrilineatus]|uniref:microprocessor complex subunit DGCR8-like n=1 Tax=Macrosteles quadrilineatus TaxID=74068 RepID=UPI0023E0D414|nr:microprocessor complex subunit DGCR8-like [Macrosteles quadrilineatus]
MSGKPHYSLYRDRHVLSSHGGNSVENRGNNLSENSSKWSRSPPSTQQCSSRLPEKSKSSGKEKPQVRLKHKTVMKEISHNHFDSLPEGWVKIMHSSGMQVYLEKNTRVCTMSPPYYLGPACTSGHKVPLSAIPCLQYKRALEEEKKLKEEKEKKQKEEEEDKEKNNEQVQKNPQAIQLFTTEIETSEENGAKQSLEALEIREYCKSLFTFKTVIPMAFKSRADRRKYKRMTKDSEKRPSLPGGTTFLKFPKQNADSTNSRSKGERIVNPKGKSSACIVHEYVQHALKKPPTYEYKEVQDPDTPYSATAFIGDVHYGIGMGASKKQAKEEAAKASLEILIPDMNSLESLKNPKADNTSILEQIRIEDPRAMEFCVKASEPSPYAILRRCLSQHSMLDELQSHYKQNPKIQKEGEYTMAVGEHKVTVVCENKSNGKQLAAQAILQALHPNIKHWGPLLRKYGSQSIEIEKEWKREQKSVTTLQKCTSKNQPNFAVLEKLRSEMLKLKVKKELQAKQKLTPPENDTGLLPSLSLPMNKINLPTDQ